MVGIFAVADGSAAYLKVYFLDPLELRFHEAACCRKSALYDSDLDHEKIISSHSRTAFISNPRTSKCDRKIQYWTPKETRILENSFPPNNRQI